MKLSLPRQAGRIVKKAAQTDPKKRECEHNWQPLSHSHNDEFSGSWRCKVCDKQIWGSPY